MSANPEKLRTNEGMPMHEASRAQAKPSFEVAKVELLFAKRSEMLASLGKVIKPSLQAALKAKIEKERSILSGFLATESEAREVERKRAQMLDDRYFTKKPLNLNAL